MRRSILESSLFNEIFKYKSTHTQMNELYITCVQFLLHSCQFSKLLWFIQKLQLRSSFQVPRIAHLMCKYTPQKLHYTTTQLGQGRKVREQDQIFTIKTSKFKLRGKDTITHILFSQEEKVNIYKAFEPQEFRDTSHQLFKKQLVSYRAEKKEGQVTLPEYKHCMLPSFSCQ